jgi:hypothetical protein
VELNFHNDFARRGCGADCLAVTAGLVMPVSSRWRINVGVQRAITGRNSDEFTAPMLAVKVAW